MKIQDIKTPGFLTEPRLMGEQSDDGIGKVHYSAEFLGEMTKANYYKNTRGQLYYHDTANDKWYVLQNGAYQPCDAPFQIFN